MRRSSEESMTTTRIDDVRGARGKEGDDVELNVTT
jgi:hypothetical protein